MIKYEERIKLLENLSKFNSCYNILRQLYVRWQVKAVLLERRKRNMYKRSSDLGLLADRTVTNCWHHPVVCLSVCHCVCPSVTLCIVALRVGVRS